MNKYAISILLTLTMIFYIIIDLIFNDNMWSTSIRLTFNMQEEEFIGETLIYEFFTYIVFIPPLAAFYCFLFKDNKLNSILYMTITAISVTANELLKSIYHQPRPYMVETSISGLKCNADYGKPSGHSQNSVVMMIMMPFLLFPQLVKLQKRQTIQVVDVVYEENRKSKTGYTIESNSQNYLEQDKLSEQIIFEYQSNLSIILKVIILLFFIISIFMTGLSRIYLGVHSIGQVILGWSYGLYISLMYILLFHQQLRKLVEKIIDRQPQQYNYMVPLQLLLLIVLLAITICLLQLNIHVFIDDIDIQMWISKINECSHHNPSFTLTSPSILYNGCCQTTAIGAVITGLIIGGINAKGKYFEGRFEKNYQNLKTRERIFRILLLIGPFLCLLPFLFINSDSIYIQTFLKMLPLGFLAGIIINFIYPLLLRKFNLQIKGDFLSIEENSLLSSEIKDTLQFTLESNQFNQFKAQNDQY